MTLDRRCMTARQYVAYDGYRMSEKTARRRIRRAIEIYHAVCAAHGEQPKPVEFKVGSRKTYYDLSPLPFLGSNSDR